MSAVYDHIVYPAAARFGVPPEWILATIGTETSFSVPAPTTWAPSAGEYAYGPMQILLSTAQSMGFRGTGEQLADPEFNIPVGAKYLAYIRGRNGDDFAAAASEYYSGNPNRYKTDPDVARHVDRALTWLSRFTDTQEPAVALASKAVVVALGIIGTGLLARWLQA